MARETKAKTKRRKPRNLMEAVLMARPGPPRETFEVWVSSRCVDAGQFFVSKELPMGHTPEKPGHYRRAKLTVDLPSPPRQRKA